MPVVLVDHAHDALPTVTVDDVEGGRMATEHLLELGHRRIAFAGDTVDGVHGASASSRRCVGYQRALGDAGVPVRPSSSSCARTGARRPRSPRDLLALASPADGGLRRLRPAGARRCSRRSRRSAAGAGRSVGGRVRRRRAGPLCGPDHRRAAAGGERHEGSRAAARGAGRGGRAPSRGSTCRSSSWCGVRLHRRATANRAARSAARRPPRMA